MSTLTDYEVTVWEGTDQNAQKFALGSKLQTAQTDITTLQDQVAAIDGVYPTAKGYGYIGTRTVVQINALTPATGMVVVAGSAGTPTAGTSSLLAVGDVAEYDGTSWIKIVSHSGGFVPVSTVLIVASTASTLYSPLTTGTDGDKLATFDGTSNTPALTVPADGVAYAISGTSVNSGKIYQFQTGAGWAVVTTPLSDTTPAAIGTASAGVAVKASRSDHVHAHGDQSAIGTALHASSQSSYTDSVHNKIPAASNTAQLAIQGLNSAMPFDSAQYAAAAADRAPSDAAENAFATTYTLPANALAAGSEWKVSADCLVAGVSGSTPGLVLKLKLDGNAAATATFAPAVSGDRARLEWTVKVGVAGASGVAVIDQKSIGSTGAGAGTGTIVESTLFNAAFDTTTTHVVTVTAQWDETDAADLVDLRFLNSSYRLAAAVT